MPHLHGTPDYLLTIPPEPEGESGRLLVGVGPVTAAAGRLRLVVPHPRHRDLQRARRLVGRRRRVRHVQRHAAAAAQQLRWLTAEGN